MNLILHHSPVVRRSVFLPGALFLAVACATLSVPALAQSDADIETLLKLHAKGEKEGVLKKLDGYLKTNPEHPGVLYLQGVTKENADEAVPFFKKISEEYPKSSWADDALHRLEQYSYAVGAYNTAEKYHAKLVSKYPNSPYVKTPSHAAAEATATTGVKSYTLAIGPYKTEKEAKHLLAQLKNAGYSVTLHLEISRKVKNRFIWLGSFSTRKTAQNMLKKLKKQQNISSVIIARP